VEKGIGGGCAPIPFSIHLDASLYLGCIAQIQDEIDHRRIRKKYRFAVETLIRPGLAENP
jgi:hypothetical protein